MKQNIKIILAYIFIVMALAITSSAAESTVDYQLINSNGDFDATVQSGSADGGTLNGAVLKLNSPVVMPIGEGSQWELEFSGTLLANSSSGCQYLANITASNGKVYFGANRKNNVMYIGVCIGTTSANYCWAVSSTVMSENHSYKITYGGEEFLLSIDGAVPISMSTYNVNQSNIVSVDGKKASDELIMKIRSMVGTDYLVMNYVGVNSHTCTSYFEYFNITVSDVSGYDSQAAHFLADKTVFYLGSSVTRGHGGNTDGSSFADITSSLTGSDMQKQAVSGTCLAVRDGKTNSYVERFENFDFSNTPNVMVVQLSTNDFKAGVPLGSVGKSKNLADFDSTTITGAIEAIIAKSLEKNNDIKVVIYTCPIGETWSNYADYQNYIDEYLYDIAEKWLGTVYLLDLFNADYIESASYIQSDNLHPQKEGYSQLFTPKFITLLYNVFTPVEVRGDANGDGDVNLIDFIRVMKSMADNTVTVSHGADVDGDGVVNLFDALSILKSILNNA